MLFCESALRKLVKPKRMCWDESPLGWRYPCVGEITKVLKNDTPRITRPLTTTYLHWWYQMFIPHRCVWLFSVFTNTCI